MVLFVLHGKTVLYVMIMVMMKMRMLMIMMMFMMMMIMLHSMSVLKKAILFSYP